MVFVRKRVCQSSVDKMNEMRSMSWSAIWHGPCVYDPAIAAAYRPGPIAVTTFTGDRHDASLLLPPQPSLPPPCGARRLARGAALAAEPIKIGLVTALSGQSALAGEAITRGLSVAIDEINAKGGLLGGRKLELVRRDDEANPAKGVIAARELIFKEKVAVLFGGLDTPVSMAIVPLVNQEKVPFMGPWAAGTGITKNGANPNFAFRVSAVDEIVDMGMLDYAQKTFKAHQARHDPGQQPLGRVQREGPQGRAGRQGHEGRSASRSSRATTSTSCRSSRA